MSSFTIRRYRTLRRRVGSPAALGLALALLTSPVTAASWLVDPARGVADGADGSHERPFASIPAVFAAQGLAGGDTVCLAPGDYGAVRLDKVGFDAPVTILSPHGDPARFRFFLFNDTRNIALDGVTFLQERPEASGGFMIEESGRGNVMRNLDLYGRAELSDYRGWTKADWLERTRGGIRIRGRDARVENSMLTGITEGIGSLGAGTILKDNTIRGFSADAIRVIGDNSTVRGNYVADCVKVDGNHDDGVQSWSRGESGGVGTGTVTGLTIEDNAFVEWSGPALPQACVLQGVGFFDGMFEDTAIRRNLISVSAYHGIGVLGATNIVIEDNLLINARGLTRDIPWVQVRAHKDGRPSSGLVLRGNIAPSFSIEGALLDGPVARHNMTTRYPLRDLAYDPALSPGSPIRETSGRGVPLGVQSVATGALRPVPADPDRDRQEAACAALVRP